MRRDFLASFCFVQEGDAAKELKTILAFTQKAAAHYLYFEVLYMIRSAALSSVEAAGGLLSDAKNLRIIIADGSGGYYRRRAAVAAEAIGEVVVISAANEIGCIDCFDIADRAFEKDRIHLARRNRLSRMFYHPFYAALRALSAYRVNPADMKTIAAPREKLAAILLRPTAALDLRFEPKHSVDNYERYRGVSQIEKPSALKFRERYDLAIELLTASVADFLRAYAAFSLVVFLCAIAYGLYAVGLYFFYEGLEPGWFSAAIVQAGSVGFIAGGIGLLSLGSAEIYIKLRAEDRSQIVGELSNTSFFAANREINVETDDADPMSLRKETVA